MGCDFGMSGKTYTVRDFSERFGLSARTLSRWHESGKLPHRIFESGEVCYTDEDVQVITEIVKSRPEEKRHGHFCEDLTGRAFGKLTVKCRVEDYVTKNGNHYTRWRCTCECGNEIDVYGKDLRSGIKVSCGCVRRPRKKIGQGDYVVRQKPDIDKSKLPRTKSGRYDLRGLRFGRLVVSDFGENKITLSGYARTTFSCVCDCGKIVTVDTSALLSGHTMSCGCQQRDIVKAVGHASGDDFVGKRFSKWLVLGPGQSRGSNKSWHCRCDCGTERDVRGTLLVTGASVSCGCIRANVPDIIGKKFGMLTVVKRADDRIFSGDVHRCWTCECDCGTICDILETSLITGHSFSCGCNGHSTSKMERFVVDYFSADGIRYDQHVRYGDLFGSRGGLLSYDFLVYRDEKPFFLLECQGCQHYAPVDYFGGIDTFERQQEHDKLKRDYANAIGIPLFEISYENNTASAINQRLDELFLNIV